MFGVVLVVLSFRVALLQGLGLLRCWRLGFCGFGLSLVYGYTVDVLGLEGVRVWGSGVSGQLAFPGLI